jgi:IclR family transcriptional regulator, KDG regulon repressor
MKSLNKALDVLEVFLNDREDENIRLSELAQLTGQGKTSVSRIVSTLTSRGYLKQDKARGKYSLDSKFLQFSGVIKRQNNIRYNALPYLLEMVQVTRESANLNIFMEKKHFFGEIIPGSYPIRLIVEEGYQMEPYCHGPGKILLSSMTSKELDNYLNSIELKAFTPNTITDKNLLKDHIKRVIDEGVAIDNEEFLLGIRNVSAAVKDADGEITGAIGLIGHAFRLTPDRVREMIPYIKNCASNISKQLGYKDA